MRINDHFENNLLYKNSYTFPPFSFCQRNKWFPLDIDIDTVIFHTSWKKRKGIASVDFKDCNLTHFPENYGDAALKWILLNLSTWPFYIAVFYRKFFYVEKMVRYFGNSVLAILGYVFNDIALYYDYIV